MTDSHGTTCVRRWDSAFVVGCLLAALLGPFGTDVLAQPADERGAGRTLYATYCASCHGMTATGQGPAAGAMRQPPPDLTRLTLANGGTFPRERLARIIDGRDVEAHGDREMPVWGDTFSSLRSGRSNDLLRARIAAILAFLESIQRRQA